MHICRLIVVLPLLLNAGCERQTATAPDQVPAGFLHPPGHQHPAVELTPEMRQQLAALHPLFAKYHDQDKALEDGYEFVGPCVSDPVLGGMGDHYSLNAEDDFGRGDGTYALQRPQYLVYAPQENGRRRLAALDYTVPYAKWQGQEPPSSLASPSPGTMALASGCSISGCSSTILRGHSPTSIPQCRCAEATPRETGDTSSSACDFILCEGVW